LQAGDRLDGPSGRIHFKNHLPSVDGHRQIHTQYQPTRIYWGRLRHTIVKTLSALIIVTWALAAPLAQAQSGLLFKGADLALGEKLIAEHQCTACHARKVGGNGHAIYRPKGKINTAGLLRGMVDYCSTELNMGLFPEEVTAVAAVLDRDHYRFEQQPASKR
jgi:hypothetical protein